jgi:hypothetical protein
VVLAPQLAQPLHVERLGRDDQSTDRSSARVRQAVRSCNRWSCQMPRPRRRIAAAPGSGRSRAPRRPGRARGNKPHTAEDAQPRPGARQPSQVQDVDAGDEVFGLADPPAASPTRASLAGAGLARRSESSASLDGAIRAAGPTRSARVDDRKRLLRSR